MDEQPEVPDQPRRDFRIVDPSQMDLFKDFIASQREEISLRREELDLRKLEAQQNHKVAEQALNYQAQDLREQRGHQVTISTRVGVGIIVIVVVVLGFALFAFYLNKEAAAMEIIRTLITTTVAGLGAYFYGYKRGADRSASGDE